MVGFLFAAFEDLWSPAGEQSVLGRPHSMQASPKRKQLPPKIWSFLPYFPLVLQGERAPLVRL